MMSSDSCSSTGFDLTTINKREKTNFWRSNDKFGKGALHDAKLARLIPAKLGLNEFCVCQWSFVNIDVPDGSEKTTCGRVFDSSEALFAHIFDVHRIKFKSEKKLICQWNYCNCLSASLYELVLHICLEHLSNSSKTPLPSLKNSGTSEMDKNGNLVLLWQNPTTIEQPVDNSSIFTNKTNRKPTQVRGSKLLKKALDKEKISKKTTLRRPETKQNSTKILKLKCKGKLAREVSMQRIKYASDPEIDDTEQSLATATQKVIGIGAKGTHRLSSQQILALKAAYCARIYYQQVVLVKLFSTDEDLKEVFHLLLKSPSLMRFALQSFNVKFKEDHNHTNSGGLEEQQNSEIPSVVYVIESPFSLIRGVRQKNLAYFCGICAGIPYSAFGLLPLENHLEASHQIVRSLELGKYVKRTGKKIAFNASYEFEESASSNQSSSSGSVSASQSPILLERLIQQEIVKNSNFIVDHLVATLLTFGGNSKENSTVLGFKANPAMCNQSKAYSGMKIKSTKATKNLTMALSTSHINFDNVTELKSGAIGTLSNKPLNAVVKRKYTKRRPISTSEWRCETAGIDVMPRRALENISQLQVIRDFILPKHFFATSKKTIKQKQRTNIIKKVGKTGIKKKNALGTDGLKRRKQRKSPFPKVKKNSDGKMLKSSKIAKIEDKTKTQMNAKNRPVVERRITRSYTSEMRNQR